LLAALTVTYLGGPGLARWIPGADRVAWKMPWKRKRLQRTFSAMLAVLLDSGVPEADAIVIAGDSTANGPCRRRAEKVAAALREGMTLSEAVRFFDDSGEFRWRLANATHAKGGFLRALQGWHQALDAKAFQQEETTAHAFTSGLVIVNGLLVALIATAMFGIIVAVLQGMLLST